MEKLTDKYLWKSLKEGDLNAFAVLFETSQMTYDGSHFSQLGTMFNLSLNYQF
ncbi:hypothetical protein N9X82_02805 [Polaribacter sp.]|jgi:iron complex outermembrane receptor protein|nr:hypothetical protein [Polaribacter sp.]MDB4171212.1 hypothetical protein [Polaribacter sp.]MDC1373919.1 hypothetical protein [Polaribacter sp.]